MTVGRVRAALAITYDVAADLLVVVVVGIRAWHDYASVCALGR